jgi:two-component system chemotaxis response regulator CheB
MTIAVVVVDDSALVRSVLTDLIDRTPDMKVVGTAADPFEAREVIRALDPDVVTLDVEMPRMDGLDFLEKLMRLRPTPVVMVSTLTERGAATTIRALELGAIDFIPKPVLSQRHLLEEFTRELAGKIRVAAKARVGRRSAAAAAAGNKPARVSGPRVISQKLIAIGASTGGTEAIREVLTVLPADVPGIVITQHMPPGFTASFAQRLDGLCAVRVKEAAEGEPVLQGHAYIAPGGRHLEIARSAGGFVTRVTDAEPVNRHKPSVEVLFRSVAKHAGPRATGVMFTGMGGDGAQAMREMRDAGAYNLVQDEASCVVFGMPREAIRHGAADEVVPLSSIARRLLARLGRATL